MNKGYFLFSIAALTLYAPTGDSPIAASAVAAIELPQAVIRTPVPMIAPTKVGLLTTLEEAFARRYYTRNLPTVTSIDEIVPVHAHLDHSNESHVFVEMFIRHMLSMQQGAFGKNLSSFAVSCLFFGHIKPLFSMGMLINKDVLQAYEKGAIAAGLDAYGVTLTQLAATDHTLTISENNRILRDMHSAFALRSLQEYCKNRTARWNCYINALGTLDVMRISNPVNYSPACAIAMPVLRFELYLALLKEMLVAKVLSDSEKKAGFNIPTTYTALQTYMATDFLPGRGAATALSLSIPAEHQDEFMLGVTSMIQAYQSNAITSVSSLLLHQDELNAILYFAKPGEKPNNIGMIECISYVGKHYPTIKEMLAKHLSDVGASIHWNGTYQDFPGIIQAFHDLFQISTQKHLQQRMMQAVQVAMCHMGRTDALAAQAAATPTTTDDKVATPVTPLTLADVSIDDILTRLERCFQITTIPDVIPTALLPFAYLALPRLPSYKTWLELDKDTGRKHGVSYGDHKIIEHGPYSAENLLTLHVTKWMYDMLLSTFLNESNSNLGVMIWDILINRLIKQAVHTSTKISANHHLVCSVLYSYDSNGHPLIHFQHNILQIIDVMNDKTDTSLNKNQRRHLTNAVLNLYYFMGALLCRTTEEYSAHAKPASDKRVDTLEKLKDTLINSVS